MFGSLASEQNSITRICRSVRGIIMGDLGDLSFWHWLILLGYIASVTVPFYKIFPACRDSGLDRGFRRRAFCCIDLPVDARVHAMAAGRRGPHNSCAFPLKNIRVRRPRLKEEPLAAALPGFDGCDSA
jgi:hypothetical protein